MSARQPSSLSDETPTPVPSSSVAATSGRNAALLAYFASPSPESREMDAAWEEALALYGDEDSDAWIAALEDGTHPLCRVRLPGHDGGRPPIPPGAAARSA